MLTGIVDRRASACRSSRFREEWRERTIIECDAPNSRKHMSNAPLNNVADWLVWLQAAGFVATIK